MTFCEIDFVLDQCGCTELFYGPEWGRLCNASLWVPRITL